MFFKKIQNILIYQDLGKEKHHIKWQKKHIGPQIFYEDAFNQLAQEEYENGIKENNLEVVTKPEIDVVQIEKGKDLIFTAIVGTKPEVILGKYKGIEIKKSEYKVSKEEIEKEIEKMAEKNARLVSVETRPVESGDITIIDFEGFKDNVPFDGGKAENYELTIGSNTFIPGFEGQIIGMKKDEEKNIKVTFPKDYPQKDLSDKEVIFKVKLHEIKKKEMPEINDELAKDISEFETLEELRKDIKTKKESQAKQKEKTESEDKVIEEVTKNSKIEISEGMIELELENMLKDMEARLSYQGMKLEQYLKMINKSEQDFKTESKPHAEKQIKERLVLEAVAKTEKIAPTDEEIQEKIKEMAESYGKKAEEIKDNESLIKYVVDNLKTEKTVNLLIETAKIK